MTHNNSMNQLQVYSIGNQSATSYFLIMNVIFI